MFLILSGVITTLQLYLLYSAVNSFRLSMDKLLRMSLTSYHLQVILFKIA